MESSQEVDKLMVALNKVQIRMRGAKKDAVNPHFKNRYADLASVWEAWRDAKGPEEGLIVTQSNRPDHQGVHVVTTLWHFSGQWIRSELYLPVTKQDAQGYGSAISYARRYAFAALVGIIADDDDGNEASKTPPPPKSEPKADPEKKAAVEALADNYSKAATTEDIAKLDVAAGKLVTKNDPLRAVLVSARDAAVKRIENGVAA